MNNGEWVEWILKLGSISIAITGIIKLIEYTSRKVQETNAKRFERALAPFTKAIDKLNRMLEESQKDREALHDKARRTEAAIKEHAGKHTKQLNNHDKRIKILEDRCEIRRN